MTTDIIHPDWLEDDSLPPNIREHIQDLTARLLDCCRRLERCRQRCRTYRQRRADLRRRIVELEAAAADPEQSP
jgi:hypothetical protein